MLAAHIHKRSRTGCKACRWQHRKCDEQRPSCSSCLIRGIKCDYQRPLKWASSFSLPTASPPSQLHLEPDRTQGLICTPESSQGVASSNVDSSGTLAYHINGHELPQDDVTTKENPRYVQEEVQLEGYLMDKRVSMNAFESRRLSEKSAWVPDNSRYYPCHSCCDMGVIDRTLGGLFSRAFQSSDDEIAFRYYLDRVSSCTAAYDSDLNPYRNLAFMALSYPVLLHGILSVSTAHMNMYGQKNQNFLCYRQSQALRSLQKALTSLQSKDGQTSQSLNLRGIFSIHSAKEIALSAMIMQTSSLLMLDITNIRTHIMYALRLIIEPDYLYGPPHSIFTRTLIYRFAMVDVVLAFLQYHHPQAPLEFFMYQNHEELDIEEPSFREMHGCHQRVLSFLAQIAVLSADLANSRCSEPHIHAMGYNLETEMRLWGQRYHGMLTAGLVPSESRTNGSNRQPNSRADLDTVSECFYWAAHILLLKRVFLDPTNSTRVQLIRKHVFQLIDNLTAGCGPDSSLPFPFYIVACEATTAEDQNWVRQKHAEMLDIYRDRARELLMASVEKTWKKTAADAIPLLDNQDN